MEEKFSAKYEYGENLWVDMLVDVQSNFGTKLPTSKLLLVLGDSETGKTSLIAKMQGMEDPKKGSGLGLEFIYMNIKDEDTDDQTGLGAWILDSNLCHRNLLKFALPEQSFAHAVVLLVATISKPWDIMESLKRWVEVLTAHIQRLKLPTEARQKQHDTLLRQFEGDVESEEGEAESPSLRAMTENLGIPIVVVLTKTDSISALEKDHAYREETWVFVQQHVRKFCLKYGAALVYCSVKENKNCVLLYQYLLHRIYGFRFTCPACVVEKDSVFIPSGWDSEKKISLLYDKMSRMGQDDHFNDVIVRPITRKPEQRAVEVLAEDRQTFLLNIQDQLAKQPQQASAAAAGQSVEGAKMNPAASSDTGVLANFFNSLRNRKLLAERQLRAMSSTSSAETALSNDAAAELSRMTQERAAASSDSVND